MEITDKNILDDYKSQVISILRLDRILLKFPKRKFCDILYIVRF